jgi:hypothetical protein
MSSRRLAAALASVFVLLAGSSARAQAAPAGGTDVQMPMPAFPSAPNVRAVMASLPPMPHDVQPDALPFPDYFDEALKHTRHGPPSTSLQLRGFSSGERPRIIVLPVQTQAFGYAPAWRALLGAQLDHELSMRRIEASRQTDILGAHGPFTRRFNDAAVAAFARDQAPSSLLALIVGHDGADTAFVTLVLRGAGTTPERRAQRRIPLPVSAVAAFDAVAALLPSLLSDIGLGGQAPASRAEDANAMCDPAAWDLKDPPMFATPVVRACHAAIVSTLLPRLSPPRTNHHANTETPAKLAWLAEAWVQARAMRPRGSTAAAIESLVWQQLRLEEQKAVPLSDLADAGEPVLAPLAKLLAVHRRAASSPLRSGREAVERLVDEASQGQSPFVSALFRERARYSDNFQRVDLCAIERETPSIMPRAECRRDGASGAARGGAAHTALYQHWRLASYFKDIDYYGNALGQRSSLARHLDSLPADIAAHPFVRQYRALSDEKQPSLGSVSDHVARARAWMHAFVQSTAESQRYDDGLAFYSLSEHARALDGNVMSDAQILRSIDDEARMIHVLSFDRFTSTSNPAARRTRGMPAVFLHAGSVRMLAPTGVAPRAAPTAATVAVAPASAPPLALPRSLFAVPEQPPAASAEQLRAHIARVPADMKARVALAMLLLKQGRPMPEARAVIDAYQQNQRSEHRITLSHDWARPAHALFFAGELDAARHYYERVRDVGTGSESDLHALARVPMIDGDLRGALAATDARLRRYESDYSRRDVALLSFLTGQRERGWAALQPRLASASTFELWVGAFAGHRIEGLDLVGVNAWLASQGLNRARIDHRSAPALVLHLHAVIDRLPSESDIALFQDRSANGQFNEQFAASALLTRMALRGSFERPAFDTARRALAQSDSTSNKFLQPLFTWVAWHATDNQDAELDLARKAQLGDADFELLLSKAILLALERDVAPSLQYLRAARLQMSERGVGGGPRSLRGERPTPEAYQYALALWLLQAKTGHAAYRNELLGFVRAYQRVMPAWGWLYSMEAVLQTDAKARATALCRARHLDARSYFLSLVASGKGTAASPCAASLW